jgi:hypothetical protein
MVTENSGVSGEGDLGFSTAAHEMDVSERSGRDLMRTRVKVGLEEM